MKIDFNRQINRKNTDCSKWDGQGGDYIPLWVADMDFPVAEPVLEALKKRLEHPFFGYTFPGESVYQAVISYYKRRYDFDLKKEWRGCRTNVRQLILYIQHKTPSFEKPGVRGIISLCD